MKKYFFLPLALIGVLLFALSAYAAKSNTFYPSGSGDIYIKKDGTLYSEGYEYFIDEYNTSHVSSGALLTDVKTFYHSLTHCLAIQNDGTLWGFGGNKYGELGVSDVKNSDMPIKIMDGVVHAAVGTHYSLVVKADGTLWGFGFNQFGQLGDGTKENRATPVKIMDNIDSVYVSDNRRHFLENTDTVNMSLGSGRSWGANYTLRDTRKNSGDSFAGSYTIVHSPFGALSYAIDKNSDLYQFGMHPIPYAKGQNFEGSLEPKKVLSNVLFAGGISNSSYAVTKDGMLYKTNRETVLDAPLDEYTQSDSEHVYDLASAFFGQLFIDSSHNLLYGDKQIDDNIYGVWFLPTDYFAYYINGDGIITRFGDYPYFSLPNQYPDIYTRDYLSDVMVPSEMTFDFSSTDDTGDDGDVTSANTDDESITEDTLNQKETPFNDIGTLPAETQNAITFLADKGIVTGIADNLFAPSLPMSREQIATLLTKAVNVYDPDEDGGFIDAGPGVWYFGAAGSAKKAGFITGYPDGTFKGDDLITKEQMVVMAARLLTANGFYPVESADSYLTFTDADSISDWARETIALAVREGLIDGDGTLVPEGQITRADACVILKKLIDRLEG